MVNDILPEQQSVETARPAVRSVGLGGIRRALSGGFADFRANPLHRMFVVLVYPILGLLLGWLASGAGTLPLLYPVAAGFAIVGPLASVGLYEISRRRELGLPSSWFSEFAVFRAPRLGAIIEIGLLLAVLFVMWLLAANGIYNNTLRGMGSNSIKVLLQSALTTRDGWILFAAGTGVGFLCAVAALSVGVVSLPLLLDRDLGGVTEEQAAAAIETSVRAVIANPVAMAAWGVVVVFGLMFGALTALVGLLLVMPILGHATWHLYRQIIV